MKKKLLLTLLIIITACLFTLSISAKDEVTLVSGAKADFTTVFKVGTKNGVENVVLSFNEGYDKNSVTDVIFPDEINGIECNGLFGESTSIQTLIFAATDEFFISGDNIFSKCSVQTVTFNPNCVVDFKKGNFSDCTSLTQITFPKFIGLAGSAFKNCSNMVNTNELVFAEGMTSIGGHAFNGCSKLRGTVYFPASLETINEYTFQKTGFDYFDLSKCSSLTKVGGNYGGPFNDCDNITKLDLSGCTSLTAIEKTSFAYGCDNLVEVILPPNLITLGGKAFGQCTKLPSIVLPKSCTSIGDEAFMYVGNSLTTKTFTMYIQSNVVFPSSSGYGVFQSSSAKVEFVLFGDSVTLESFTSANASGRISGSKGTDFATLANVNYMDPANKWGYTVGGAISNHTIIYNYCDSLALTKSHTATDAICANTDYCADCEYLTCLPHEGSISITYPNGYDAKGRKDTCAVANCNGNLKIELKPLFEALGYSVRENMGYGIVSTYQVNIAELEEFEALNGKLSIGVILANASFDGQSEFMTKNSEGKYVLNSSKGIQVEIPSTDYSRIEAGVHNFTQDAVDLNLVIALYVADENGVSFVQHEGTYAGEVTKGEVTLDTVTITKIAELTDVTLPFVVPTPSGNEENE